MKEKVIDILKKFGLWFISILFLEFIFILIMKNRLELDSTINILLYSMILSSVLSVVTNIFKRKINTVITAVMLFIFGVLFSLQCVFYSIFKIYFSVSNLGLGDQVTSYLDKAFSAILSNIFNIIAFMIPFIVYLVFKKKLNIQKNDKWNYLVFTIIFVIISPVFYLYVNSSKGVTNGTYDLYHNVNEVNLNIHKLGVLNSYNLDLYRVIFGFVPKDIEYVDADSIDKKDEEEEEIPEEEVIVYEPNT